MLVSCCQEQIIKFPAMLYSNVLLCLLLCRLCVQRDSLPGGLCSRHGGHPGNVMWPGGPLGARRLVQRRRRAGAWQPDAAGPEDAAHHQRVVRGLGRLLVPTRPQQHAAQQLHHPGDRWEKPWPTQPAFHKAWDGVLKCLVLPTTQRYSVHCQRNQKIFTFEG